jgi:hypothetical protein
MVAYLMAVVSSMWLRQGGERRDPVVVQEPGEGEDLGGAGDAEVAAVQGRRELGPGDRGPGLVAGEHDGQCAAGLGDDPVVPAAGGGQVRGDAPGLLQGRAGDRRGGPLALVEVQRLAGRAQLQLGPAGRGGRRGGADWHGLPGRAGAAQSAHARQRQLPVAAGLKVFRREPAARGGEAAAARGGGTGCAWPLPLAAVRWLMRVRRSVRSARARSAAVSARSAWSWAWQGWLQFCVVVFADARGDREPGA